MFIYIPIPISIAVDLVSLKIPGESIMPTDMHVTLFFSEKDLDIHSFCDVITICHTVTARFKPFKIGTTRAISFPLGEDGVPIVSKIVSPWLLVFRDYLRGAFDEIGIDYSRKFPEYKPHVTLSYNDKPVSDIVFQPLVWEVDLVNVESKNLKVSIKL
jgi:2'-5' RNA ligase